MYIYQADTYCDDCANKIIIGLNRDGIVYDISHGDLYDTDVFPAGPYPESQCESDYLVYCAGCAGEIDCSLTAEGVEYTLGQLDNSDPHSDYAIRARKVLRDHGMEVS